MFFMRENTAQLRGARRGTGRRRTQLSPTRGPKRGPIEEQLTETAEADDKLIQIREVKTRPKIKSGKPGNDRLHCHLEITLE